MTTHTLMEEIRTMRAHSRQQGETKDSEAVRVISNHDSSNVRTRNSSDDNRKSINGGLTTQQLDKLLDRYDGFVPQVVQLLYSKVLRIGDEHPGSYFRELRNNFLG
jgi:hypothetical protein